MKRRVTPKFWAFMIITMVAIFGACFAVTQHHYAQAAEQLAQVTAYRDQLSDQVDALSEKLEYVQTDEYIIRAARDELGMIMPGEIRYVNSST